MSNVVLFGLWEEMRDSGWVLWFLTTFIFGSVFLVQYDVVPVSFVVLVVWTVVGIICVATALRCMFSNFCLASFFLFLCLVTAGIYISFGLWGPAETVRYLAFLLKHVAHLTDWIGGELLSSWGDEIKAWFDETIAEFQ